MADIVETSSADFWTGCIPVIKKNGEIRPTVDERPLNRITVPLQDTFFTTADMLRWMSETSEASERCQEEDDRVKLILGEYFQEIDLHDTRFFISTLDFKSGFFQLNIPEHLRSLFTFITPWEEKLQYKRLVQGWINSSAWFDRAMKKLRGEPTDLNDVMNYIDDVVIKSIRFNRHLLELTTFFDRFRRWNLKIRAAKCDLSEIASYFRISNFRRWNWHD
jgi:hypothetical protein